MYYTRKYDNVLRCAVWTAAMGAETGSKELVNLSCVDYSATHIAACYDCRINCPMIDLHAFVQRDLIN